MNIIWTVEQTGLLAQAWGAGHASREIASMVGMSASAVRCKRRRLGLPARSEVSQEATEHARGVALAGPKVPDNPSYTATCAPPLAGSMPRPWTQRMARECAWPVLGFGDETLSCCLPVEGRGPYCAGHMALMRREPWPPTEAVLRCGSALGVAAASPSLQPPAAPGNVLLFHGHACKVKRTL
jgi:hypothetical protein